MLKLIKKLRKAYAENKIELSKWSREVLLEFIIKTIEDISKNKRC